MKNFSTGYTTVFYYYINKYDKLENYISRIGWIFAS